MQTASTNRRSNVKNRTRARGQVLARHSRRASAVKTRSCIELGKCFLKSASDPGYIDEPVMRSTGTAGAKHYFHRNQQYSITAITDGSGAISERYAYSAYGTPTITDASGTARTLSAVGNRYSYTGREWDETLALYHYRARIYDSVAGRFVSRDPIGFEGSPWNLYEYVGSASLSKLDPSGLAMGCGTAFNLCIEAAADAAAACRAAGTADAICIGGMLARHSACGLGLDACILRMFGRRLRCMPFIMPTYWFPDPNDPQIT